MSASAPTSEARSDVETRAAARRSDAPRLSAARLALLEQVRQLVREHEARFGRRFDPAEQAKLIELLQRPAQRT